MSGWDVHGVPFPREETATVRFACRNGKEGNSDDAAWRQARDMWLNKQMVHCAWSALARRLGALLVAGMLAPPATGEGAAKPVFVHYMPWFVAKPPSGHWGYHWTLNSRNPDLIEASGQRQIASHYHPLIGPYDSADPVVLEHHVLLMKLAGIDGVIVDWYGQADVHDYALNEQRTRAILKAARKARLQFCLCYEDRTVRAAIDTGHIPAEEAVEHGQQALLYAQSNYFVDPAYYRLTNGRPVLLNFGPDYFRNPRQWAALFSVLDSTNRPAFFTLNTRLPVGDGAFNWPPMQLSATNGGTLSHQTLADYLDGFERDAAAWPAFISSAFPRFHDFYAEAGLHASYGYLDDDGGATFRHTLARALTNHSVMVQVVTWNDYGEGTIIEPTTEFGYRDLAVLQELRRTYLDAGFRYQTNHLHLATRFHDLRRRHAGDPVLSAELDRVFLTLTAGEVDQAELRLAALESIHPAIYDAALTNRVLRFSVGGYLSPSGVEVQTTSNLNAAWQRCGTLAVGTNQVGFAKSLVQHDAPAYFRVRTLVP